MQSLCKLRWGWSSFHEETEFNIYYETEEEKNKELKKKILEKILKISRRLTFDCGDLSRPLNPYITGIEIIPIIDTEYISFCEDKYLFIQKAFDIEKSVTEENIKNKNNFTENGNYNYNASKKTLDLFGLQ